MDQETLKAAVERVMDDGMSDSADITLAGGFECVLTKRQVNQWVEFVRQADAWQELVAIQAKLHGCDIRSQAGVDCGDEAEGLFLRKAALEDQLYAIGKRWWEENVRPKWRKQETT